MSGIFVTGKHCASTLPSGNHVWLDPRLLHDLFDKSSAARDPALLDQIRTTRDLSAYIEIGWRHARCDDRDYSSNCRHALQFNVPVSQLLSVGLQGVQLNDLREVQNYLALLPALYQMEAWLSEVRAHRRGLSGGINDWDSYDIMAAILRLDRQWVRGRIPPSFDRAIFEYLHGVAEGIRMTVTYIPLLEVATTGVVNLASKIREIDQPPDKETTDRDCPQFHELAWTVYESVDLVDLRPIDAEAVDIFSYIVLSTEQPAHA